VTTVLRHLLSILILPVVVVILVPYWLHHAFAFSDSRWPAGIVSLLGPALGLLLVLIGFALLAWCISLFVQVGQGTLAPWDPTRKLVAIGPYRYVRNPMISGVIMMLAGQALYWGSWVLAAFALFAFLLNHFYFIHSEEPGLEKRFGASYLEYKKTVPRWLPRLK
jgi:protein-S-isoprenylcysteine O-methyltransferase Ste14